MNITTLFEPASSDGWMSTGDGTYYLSEHLADAAARARHQGNAASSIKHLAVEIGLSGTYLLLKSPTPVHVVGTAAARSAIAASAIKKLSPDEIESLKFAWGIVKVDSANEH